MENGKKLIIKFFDISDTVDKAVNRVNMSSSVTTQGPSVTTFIALETHVTHVCLNAGK